MEVAPISQLWNRRSVPTDVSSDVGSGVALAPREERCTVADSPQPCWGGVCQNREAGRRGANAMLTHFVINHDLKHHPNTRIWGGSHCQTSMPLETTLLCCYQEAGRMARVVYPRTPTNSVEVIWKVSNHSQLLQYLGTCICELDSHLDHITRTDG